MPEGAGDPDQPAGRLVAGRDATQPGTNRHQQDETGRHVDEVEAGEQIEERGMWAGGEKDPLAGELPPDEDLPDHEQDTEDEKDEKDEKSTDVSGAL